MVTDRNTLDNQLLQRFNEAADYLQTEPIHISSRKNLINELKNKKSNGIYFTTIEKLEEATGLLSDRKDIYVICDEAHRTQNSINEEYKIVNDGLKIKRGFAAFLRDAFPNAVYIGFTGTPLLGGLKIQTTDIFGDYTDKYLPAQAEADGVILKKFYENVAIDIKIPEKLKKEIDALQEAYLSSLKNDVEEIKNEKLLDLDHQLTRPLILENPEVIKIKAKHLMEHYFKRENVLHGKALIVTSSRNSAFLYYKSICELYPDFKEKLILILSKSNKEIDDEISSVQIPYYKIDEVEKEYKKDNSKYKIAIVCDM
jgi:type I restriction enzyme R subunit